jgi:hypothetical protein
MACSPVLMIDFVLDEDIYHRAMEAECTLKSFDLRAARVVDILQASHRWVITPEVEVAYRKRFNQVECHGALTTSFIARLDQSLATQELSCLVDAAPLIGGTHSDKDQHVVNAAAARDEGCYLITSDDPLREALAYDGTPDKYHFHAIGLRDTEGLLGLG